MNKITEYSVAKNIMGKNFIGIEELKNAELMKLRYPEAIPQIPFSEAMLREKSKHYCLILGLDCFEDGLPVTIRNLKRIFGNDPDISEPCFYNQDWYDNEEFIDVQLPHGWFLIRKDVYEDSRAVQPLELMNKYVFPLAISCTYAFFCVWFSTGEKLWYHDFVWCDDTDHHGDRIYVGKYHDIDGINKNGFSIHRHLALRSCYACID